MMGRLTRGMGVPEPGLALSSDLFMEVDELCVIRALNGNIASRLD